MTQIWEDILAALMGLIHQGNGNSKPVQTAGDSNTIRVLENSNYLLPAITIVNHGTAPIKYGYNGVPSLTLPAGFSYTARWKNPVKSGLCVADTGTACQVDIAA